MRAFRQALVVVGSLSVAACAAVLDIRDPDGPLHVEADHDASSVASVTAEDAGAPNPSDADATPLPEAAAPVEASAPDAGAPLLSLVWHNQKTGTLGAWFLRGSAMVGRQTLGWQCRPSDNCVTLWRPIDTAQTNSILWHDRGGKDDGMVQAWLFDATTGAVTTSDPWTWRCTAASGCANDWTAIGRVSLSGGATTGLLWHDEASGELSIWKVFGAVVSGKEALSASCGAADGCSKNAAAIATADLNGDKESDVLWFHRDTGQLSVWLLDGTQVKGQIAVSRACESPACSREKFAGIVDANGDGHADISWLDTVRGEVTQWLLDGQGRVLETRSVALRCDRACAEELDGVRPIGFAAMTLP